MIALEDKPFIPKIRPGTNRSQPDTDYRLLRFMHPSSSPSLLSQLGSTVRAVPLRTSSGGFLQPDALKVEPLLFALGHHAQWLAPAGTLLIEEEMRNITGAMGQNVPRCSRSISSSRNSHPRTRSIGARPDRFPHQQLLRPP